MCDSTVQIWELKPVWSGTFRSCYNFRTYAICNINVLIPNTMEVWICTLVGEWLDWQVPQNIVPWPYAYIYCSVVYCFGENASYHYKEDIHLQFWLLYLSTCGYSIGLKQRIELNEFNAEQLQLNSNYANYLPKLYSRHRVTSYS